MKTIARLASAAANRVEREAPDCALEDALGLAALSLLIAAGFAVTALA